MLTMWSHPTSTGFAAESTVRFLVSEMLCSPAHPAYLRNEQGGTDDLAYEID